MNRLQLHFLLVITQIVIIVGCSPQQNKFGEAIIINDKDESSLVESKCSITIYRDGYSTGGMLDEGMIRYDFWAKIENLTDIETKLSIGPLEIGIENGNKYKGIIYNGPVLGYANGMEFVPDPVTGDPSVILVLEPKKVIEKMRIFVTMPAWVSPSEFTILIGVKEEIKYSFKYIV